MCLVDEGGKTWNCIVHQTTDFSGYWSLGGEWGNFCKAKALTEGTSILLGASLAVDNEVVFLKISPL